MRIPTLKILLTIIFINICIPNYSQDTFKKSNTPQNVLDSLRKSGVKFGTPKKPEIQLSPAQAIKFLEKRITPRQWQNIKDPLRRAFDQLIFEADHPTLDSLRLELRKYPYDSLSIPWDKFYIWEPLKVRIPVLPKISADSLHAVLSVKSDSLGLKTAGVTTMKDTTLMIVIDTLKMVTSSRPGFPLRYADYPFQSDSIQAAVKSLLGYLDKRDSTEIKFIGLGNSVTPIIVNSQKEKFVRYWLKNEFSDSVAVWIANPSRNTIGLYLEQGINFRRPVRQNNYAHPNINLKAVDKQKLLDLRNIEIKPKLWKYRTESAFVLNQSAMSNWVKGGEGSISTALDVTGYADYANKTLKVSSANFARLKFGYIATDKEGIKKNLDLLETNSKLNHLAFGKVDFSAILLFKTQLARGYNYFKTAAGKDTSNLVSKFMNPGVLTVGLGFDYKPNKKTSINFSPLSYKGTFVTDPAYYNNRFDSTKIDQTQYGIARNKKSLNEPGVSFVFSNEFTPFKTVTFVNRLQLFTNYIHNPQNVDIDWEMIATAHLNWFTDVRFNTHLIYDDDTRTSKKSSDGTEKKTARIQFKEMLGFSVSFRF